MPPPRSARVLTDEELFDTPLASENDVGVLTDEELFDAPLASEQNTRAREPMGPPAPPPEEPDVWDFLTSEKGWSEIGKSTAAFAQGASLNTADNLAGLVSDDAAQYMDEAANEYPVAHGAGQAVTGIAAGIAAPASLAAQAGTQGLLSGVSSLMDGEGRWEAAYDAALGAGAGVVGHAAGRLAAPFIAKGGEKLRGAFPKLFSESVVPVDPTPGAVRRGSAQYDELADAPDVDVLSRSGRPVRADYKDVVPMEGEVVRGTPSLEDIESAPKLDITRRSEVPRAGVYEPEGEDVLDQAFLSEAGRRQHIAPEPPTGAPIPDAYAEPAAPPLMGRAENPGGPKGHDWWLEHDAMQTLDGPRTGQTIPASPPPPPALQSVNKAPTGPAEPLPYTPELRYGDLTPERAPMGPAAPVEIPPAQFDMAPAPKPPAPQLGDALWDVSRMATHMLPPRLGNRARATMDLLGPASSDSVGHWANKVGRSGAEALWETGAPDLMKKKVNAQGEEMPAYADPATTNYALSAVLSSGASGLSPSDEQTMTSALVSGDEQQIRATNFRLRMENPRYARAIERELRSYNEESF
jgi:hypothetical protein